MRSSCRNERLAIGGRSSHGHVSSFFVGGLDNNALAIPSNIIGACSGVSGEFFEQAGLITRIHETQEQGRTRQKHAIVCSRIRTSASREYSVSSV
jgi:hypothetical protein